MSSEISLNKLNKPSLIYSFGALALIALIGLITFFIKTDIWSLPFKQAPAETGEFRGYKPFYATGNLAEGINYLPINRDLAAQKLAEIKMGLSPAADARRLYILGQISQRSNRYEEALNYYSSINLATIPYLADRVLVHKAEIGGELGREKLVLEACKSIIRNYSHSLSLASAHYELARSYLRQNKIEEAKAEFEKVKKSYASSQQGIGALYYLGQLNFDNKEQRNAFWQEYLTKSPNGRFAVDILNVWNKELDSLSSFQKSLMGLSYYKTSRKEEAGKLLSSDINAYNWFDLAQWQFNNNQKDSAKKTLLTGLINFIDTPEYLNGVNLFLRNATNVERENLLPQILEVAPDKPYILWKWANYSNKDKKRELLLTIERRYPNSIWAGKASAEIFWTAYKDSQYETAKQLGRNFIASHGNSPEAAKVKFWLAKRAEVEGDKQKARGLYNQILEAHQGSYYAFRAQGRLSELNNATDPGWTISQESREALIRSFGENWVWPLPKEEVHHLHPTLQELFSLNLWQEALTLMPKDYDKKLPALHAWLLARVEDKVNEAIKIASDEIYKRRSSFSVDHDYWLISYPFLYSSYALNSAEKYGFDPLLVLALIRQESRFQHKVISSAKAVGLCQLMPGTAREVARSINYPAPDSTALCTPPYNIELGSKYLSGLLKQFNGQGHLAVAAYNAGPGSVSKWLKTNANFDPDLFVELIPYQETQKYVINVFENYWVYTNLIKKVYAEKKFAYSSPDLSIDYPSTVDDGG
jgi:soluble lytic murein transglycosylase-like protein